MERKTVVIAQSDLERQKAVCEQIREYWLAQGRTPLAFVDTYGCQQNEADSERIRGMLQSCGYQLSDTEEGADCIVINTCAIREHAETRVYGNVGALVHTKARHPGQKIFLCGCMMGQPAVADRIKKSYRHVDGVFNPHQLWRFPELLQFVLAHNKRIFATDDSAGNIAEGLPVVRTSDLKAWVSIMYGCNNFCSYCIVPYVRGREKSRPLEDIVAEAEGYVAAGVKEIILVAQETTLYGKDLYGEKKLPELLRRLCKIGGIRWIRILYCYPEEITEELIQVMRDEPKICHYLDLPIQHASDRILKRMGRRTTQAELVEIVNKLRREIPDIVLRTTLISGFPGETQEDHEELMSFVDEMEFDRLGVFTYSPEEDTPAAEMADQIPEEVKEERRDELMELQQEISYDRGQDRIGQELLVMIEGKVADESAYIGRTYGDAPKVDGYIFVQTGELLMTGDFAKVRVTGALEYDLIGVLSDEYTE